LICYLMTDTSKEIMQKQFEIVIAIPFKDRLENLFEMTELSREIIRNRIRTERPGIGKTDLEIETFKAFYRHDFDDRTLNQIVKSMALYLEDQ
jgi:hypothetical protein